MNIRIYIGGRPTQRRTPSPGLILPPKNEYEDTKSHTEKLSSNLLA